MAHLQPGKMEWYRDWQRGGEGCAGAGYWVLGIWYLVLDTVQVCGTGYLEHGQIHCRSTGRYPVLLDCALCSCAEAPA